MKPRHATMFNDKIHMYTLHGVYHKKGSPAYINEVYGNILWFIRARQYSNTIAYCKACGYNKETQVLWVLKYGTSLPNKLEDYNNA